MRRPVAVIALFLMSLPVFAGPNPDAASSGRKVCSGGPTIELESIGTERIAYRISDPSLATSAIAELWIGPRRLEQVDVPITASGEVAFTESADDSPSWLKVGVNDLLHPIVCFDTCDREQARRESVDWIRAGWNDARSYAESPEVFGWPIRIAVGAGARRVVITGRYLTEQFPVRLLQLGTARRQYFSPTNEPVLKMEARGLDFHRAELELPAGLTSRPGVLVVQTPDSAKDHDGHPIVVVAADAPVLDRVEQGPVNAAATDVTVRLHGRNFTTGSRAITYEAVRALLGQYFVVGGETTFVSPTELILRLPGPIATYLPRNFWSASTGSTSPFEVPVWVVTDESLALVSDVRHLRVRPARSVEVPPFLPRVDSVTPYPIPLMTYDDPTSMRITVHGKHFRRDTTVKAWTNDNDDLGEERALRTEFVSSNELRAWLPRDLWLWKQRSYRLALNYRGRSCTLEVKELGW